MYDLLFVCNCIVDNIRYKFQDIGDGKDYISLNTLKVTQGHR